MLLNYLEKKENTLILIAMVTGIQGNAGRDGENTEAATMILFQAGQAESLSGATGLQVTALNQLKLAQNRKSALIYS